MQALAKFIATLRVRKSYIANEKPACPDLYENKSFCWCYFILQTAGLCLPVHMKTVHSAAWFSVWIYWQYSWQTTYINPIHKVKCQWNVLQLTFHTTSSINSTLIISGTLVWTYLNSSHSCYILGIIWNRSFIILNCNKLAKWNVHTFELVKNENIFTLIWALLQRFKVKGEYMEKERCILFPALHVQNPQPKQNWGIYM